MQVEAVAPYGGVYTVRVGEQTYAIGDVVTEAVFVRPVGSVFPQDRRDGEEFVFATRVRREIFWLPAASRMTPSDIRQPFRSSFAKARRSR